MEEYSGIFVLIVHLPDGHTGGCLNKQHFAKQIYFA